TRSTHNTRIERIWVEVGTQFARAWCGFFYRLESRHQLEITNKKHLWLLHYLFLDDINHDCKTFVDNWNCHPISGEGHDRSPMDMRLLGQVTEGTYLDEFPGVEPSVLEHYYGVEGHPIQRQPGQTGAGHPADEDSDSDSEMEAPSSEHPGNLPNHIDEDINSQFLHDAVPVPKHKCPFPDDDDMATFERALLESSQQDIIPGGFGLAPTEWEDGQYPPYEIIPAGRRGSRKLRVQLPHLVWKPRADLWGRALAIMNNILESREDDSTSEEESDS
ncbi:hypothetical protein C8J56DRAFT_1094074, partial [Mycena floridula]